MIRERSARGPKLVEKTVATVLFDDGTVVEFESDFEDTQGGTGYDGGHWGPFPVFRDLVEERVREAQSVWGKAGATVKYTRVTRKTEFIEREFMSKSFYSERRVSSRAKS